MPRLRLMGPLVIMLVAGGYAVQHEADREGGRLFDQVLSLVSDRFVDSSDAGTIYQKAARGLVHELHDPYAALISPQEMAAFTVQTAGKYGGVGLMIEDHDGDYTVGRVFPNTPGEQAGVLVGDQVLAVDGRSVDGRKFAEVTNALKGTPGTPVSVRFSRPGVSEPIEVHLTRAVIRIPGVPYAIMLDGKVGYVPLHQFTESSGAETEAAVARLLNQGARALVLDLRGNGGGYTDQALRVANLFLRPGREIYRVKTRAPAPEIYSAAKAPLAPGIPLTVLTDGGTASASEIVAGALQDHDRALILGTTTYGKGLVQTGFPLEAGWFLKVTTGRWLTPSGRSIQKPRRMLDDGRMEELSADSAGSDSSAPPRPVYRSDAGRVVYGGGGITPDVLVKAETLATADRRFLQAIAPKSQEAYLALYDMAIELKPTLTPNFRLNPEWREEFFRQLEARGVKVERNVFDSAGPYIDRMLERRLAIVAFGDSTAQRRSVAGDAQLRRALELMQKGQTQEQLFQVARGNG